MDRYRPALAPPIGPVRRATVVTLFGLCWMFGVGMIVFGAVRLVADVVTGLHGRSALHSGELDLLGYDGVVVPTWALAAVILVTGVVLVREASRVVPIFLGRHGIVDVAETAGGLVLRRVRWPASARTLAVRSGGDLAVGARLLRLSRHTYQFEFTSVDGRLIFDQDVYIDEVSMVPLDDAAGRAGITVTVTGDAQQLRRGTPGPG